MLGALILLCGLDYSDKNYKECVKNTNACYEAGKSSVAKLESGKELTAEQKKLFYTCYSKGVVSSTKKTKQLSRK